MIIDSHCHAGEYLKHFPESFATGMMASIHKPPEAITTSIPQLLAEMDAAHIDQAFLLAFDAQRTLGAKVPNEYVAEICRRYPDRFIGFGSVDGMHPDAAETVHYFVHELHLRGLKIAPAYLRLSPADPCWYGAFSAAQEAGIPVLVHVGTTPAKDAAKQYFSPTLMAKAAQDFPRLNFIMAHMGTPWVTQCIDLMVKHPNLYADLSIFGWYQSINTVAKTLETARQRGVLQRILWGTDQPWGPLGVFKERMERLRNDTELFPQGQPLTDEEWTNIMGKTALRLLPAQL
ncbi:amidohydrolase family protein [Dictyobacter kobayashii]|uniref:Amidohydrolase n=1 Tax=Dictyobacter kobayashii TaxID=2014872 RepID=A0A402ASL2_9CHLR|nr:amidohydrolase family protein [Dictyobacter kobayashii]GCE22089.1 amidohydrolase [Dictyobacter kobayashii]